MLLYSSLWSSPFHSGLPRRTSTRRTDFADPRDHLFCIFLTRIFTKWFPFLPRLSAELCREFHKSLGWGRMSHRCCHWRTNRRELSAIPKGMILSLQWSGPAGWASGLWRNLSEEFPTVHLWETRLNSELPRNFVYNMKPQVECYLYVHLRHKWHPAIQTLCYKSPPQL